MESGSQQHKAQVCQDLIKTYQENIWKEEIQLMELDELLGDFRKQKAAIDLKIEGKNKPAANQEKKLLANLEVDIESIQASIAGLQEKKTAWEKRIDLIKRYSEVK